MKVGAFGKDAAETDETLNEDDDLRVEITAVAASDKSSVCIFVLGVVGNGLFDGTRELAL